MGNSLDNLKTVQDWFLLGGWVMWPILGCSVLALAIILERIWVLVVRSDRIVSRQLVETVESLAAKGEMESLVVACRKDDSMVARVLLAGLRQLGRPHDVVREAIEDAGRRESFELDRFLNTLSSLAVVAPMMGFFGTVVGMIQTFQALSINQNYNDLSRGIYVALITTAGGLIVAIPSFLAHRLTVGLIDRRVREMEDLSINLLNALDRARENPPAPAAGPAAGPGDAPGVK